MTTHSLDDFIAAISWAKRDGSKSIFSSTSLSSRSIQRGASFAKRSLSQVVLPVPRGPNRKKLLLFDVVRSLWIMLQYCTPLLELCPLVNFEISTFQTPPSSPPAF